MAGSTRTDYYRALAESCGAPFKADLPAADVAPAAVANPRQSLAIGLLKERARARQLRLGARPRQAERVARDAGAAVAA